MTTSPEGDQGGKDPAKEFVDEFWRVNERYVGGKVEYDPKKVEFTNACLGAVGRAMAAIEGDEPVEPVVAGFVATIDEIAANTDEQSLYILDECRMRVGSTLIDANHVRQAAVLVATMRSPALMYTSIFRLGLQTLFRGEVPRLTTTDQMYEWVIQELESRDPAAAIGFLRHARLKFLDASDLKTGREMVEAANARIAAIAGEGYDLLDDWAASEAEAYPGVDWEAIKNLVGADELWDDSDTMLTKLIDAHGLGKSIYDIVSSPSLVTSGLHGLKDELVQKFSAQLETRLSGYSLGQIAIVLFGRGANVAARQMLEVISEPLARAHVADKLLQNGNVSEARRIIMALEDPHLLVGMLMSSQWPDKKLPKKILSDLIDLKTGRVGQKVISAYSLEQRTACINAFADMLEQAGAADEAAEMRRRAELLTWQVNRGHVIIRTPKR